jgi:phage gpG-like protein
MIRMKVSVNMHGTMRKLDNMMENASNFYSTFEYARHLLSLANAANFSSGGMLVGGWKPREEAAEWPIMRESNRLMGSLVSLTGPPNQIGATSATFGTAVEYAGYHQHGTSHMPSRKIVFEPRGFAEQVAQAAAEHIIGFDRYFPR